MARLAYPLRLAAVATAYFLLAKGCLEFAFRNESVSAIWGPTGLALAATLIGGYRMWPAIAIGAFAANVTTAAPVLAAAGIATGNTLEALVGAVLLRRFADFRLDLGRVKDVFALLIYGAGVSTMISATIGVACLAAAGLVDGGDLLGTWRVWWLGDAAGDLIVAPALLVLTTHYRAGWLRRPHIRPDAIALLVLLAAVVVVAFNIEEVLVYFVFPVLFWIAFRLQQPGIVVAGLIVAGLAIWFTSEGEGSFVGGSADAELLRAQTFVGVATITGLLAAALMTERARDAEQLRHLADHDQVTGLINRRAFEEELHRWLVYSSRYGVPGSVLVIDVDNFKAVNDSLGHPVGDELLRRLGGALRQRLRETDVVARWGGDEFVVLLPWAGAQRGRMVARVLLEELRAAGNDALEGRAGPVSVSIGVVSFETPDGTGPDDLLARADTTMYAAKREGGDGIYAQNGRGDLERIAAPFRPARPARGSARNV